MKKIFILLFLFSTRYTYAEYVDIGTAPSGASISINTDPRFFSKVSPPSSISDTHANDIVYKFWNIAVFKKPIKKIFCYNISMLSCKNKVVEVKKAVYLSQFNLTTNTYCDEQSKYYDKTGALIFYDSAQCHYPMFWNDVEPNGDNDFINAYLNKITQ